MRFVYLLCCCYLFLDELRAALAASGQTGATIGDASRYQHHAHYHRLLKWLQLKLETGHNISEIENLLAA